MMRLRGCTLVEIEDALVAKGQQFRISAPTIWRNLNKANLDMTEFEWNRIVEAWGGNKEVDVVLEMKNQIIVQRHRINQMCVRERQRRTDNAGYIDRRIREEMETYTEMVKTLREFTAQGVIEKTEDLPSRVAMSEEVERMLEDALISDKVSIRPVGQRPPDIPET